MVELIVEVVVGLEIAVEVVLVGAVEHTVVVVHTVDFGVQTVVAVAEKIVVMPVG